MKSYVLCYDGVDEMGCIYKGNVRFDSVEPLTWELIQKAKTIQLDSLRGNGVNIVSDKVMIVNIIRLDA